MTLLDSYLSLHLVRACPCFMFLRQSSVNVHTPRWTQLQVPKRTWPEHTNIGIDLYPYMPCTHVPRYQLNTTARFLTRSFLLNTIPCTTPGGSTARPCEPHRQVHTTASAFLRSGKRLRRFATGALPSQTVWSHQTGFWRSPLDLKKTLF